jgi:hypothetical protein
MTHHYSITIQWSDEDQKFIAHLPEFGPYTHTHGETYNAALQEKMQMRLPELKAIEQPERICSCCKVGKLITIQHFDRRGPSQTDIGMGQKSLKVSDNLQKS